MIKIYCDWCNNETASHFGNHDNPLKLYLKDDTTKHILKAEITISMDGSYNSKHICKTCALALCRLGKE